MTLKQDETKQHEAKKTNINKRKINMMLKHKNTQVKIKFLEQNIFQIKHIISWHIFYSMCQNIYIYVLQCFQKYEQFLQQFRKYSANFATTRHVQSLRSNAYYHIPNLQIQLVRNAPDDGPMRSETCRANISAE